MKLVLSPAAIVAAWPIDVTGRCVSVSIDRVTLHRFGRVSALAAQTVICGFSGAFHHQSWCMGTFHCMPAACDTIPAKARTAAIRILLICVDICVYGLFNVVFHDNTDNKFMNNCRNNIGI